MSADGLRYQDERKLPAYYNEDIIPDPETGLNLPVRSLDNFYFCDAVQFVPVPLEHLSTLANLLVDQHFHLSDGSGRLTIARDSMKTGPHSWAMAWPCRQRSKALHLQPAQQSCLKSKSGPSNTALLPCYGSSPGVHGTHTTACRITSSAR